MDTVFDVVCLAASTVVLMDTVFDVVCLAASTVVLMDTVFEVECLAGSTVTFTDCLVTVSLAKQQALGDTVAYLTALSVWWPVCSEQCQVKSPYFSTSHRPI